MSALARLCPHCTGGLDMLQSKFVSGSFWGNAIADCKAPYVVGLMVALGRSLRRSAFGKCNCRLLNFLTATAPLAGFL